MVSGVGSAIAGGEAASAENSATNAAVSEQQAALLQQAQLSQPYRDLGFSAINPLSTLLGLNGADPSQIEKQLASTPGYQFTLNQGLNATKNAATASGMLLSGNTLEGLDQFSTGLADSTYQQSVDNMRNVVGMGQAAAAGQAQNVGAAASNISSLYENQGNTIAGIDMNTVAGITNAIQGAAGNLEFNNTLKALSGG